MQVDVFTTRPFFGNPVAVVLEADDLGDDDMRRVARWTNLSETTFVLRATDLTLADYRLRIFGPKGDEVRFAGHPTIGSAHAVMESGIVGNDRVQLTQECLAGTLPLEVLGDGSDREIMVQVPAPSILPERCPDAEMLSSALGSPVSKLAEPLTIDVGPVWVVACLDDADLVRRLNPDLAAVEKLSVALGVAGVTVFAFDSANGAAVRMRSFAPAVGVAEDPVCGSGNACVGAFLAHNGLLERTGPTYFASARRAGTGDR